jgi:hypothetical protein
VKIKIIPDLFKSRFRNLYKGKKKILFRSLKLLNKKYLEAKEALEISKCQLSQIKSRVLSRRFQLNKLEQEKEIKERKHQEFETCFHLKEREYSSKYLTYEVYVRDFHKLLRQSDDVKTHPLLIKRFQNDIKQFSEELPKLKSQVNTVQGRVDYFQQRKQQLIEMHNDNKKLDHVIQLALEERIRKENHFNRVAKCRDILRNIYKCRKSNDLIKKIFYDLPIRTKLNGKNENGKSEEKNCMIKTNANHLR